MEKCDTFKSCGYCLSVSNFCIFFDLGLPASVHGILRHNGVGLIFQKVRFPWCAVIYISKCIRQRPASVVSRHATGSRALKAELVDIQYEVTMNKKVIRNQVNPVQ